MKKLGAQRLVVAALGIVMASAALFYAYPPTPGRAFFKKVDIAITHSVVGNNKRTPDHLLW
jgi:hypothetical protein